MPLRRRSNAQVFGWADGNAVALALAQPGRQNALAPKLHGQIYETRAGCRLVGAFKSTLVGRLFLTFWLGLVSAWTAISLVVLIFQTATHHSPSALVPGIGGAVMLLFGIVLTVVTCRQRAGEVDALAR